MEFMYLYTLLAAWHYSAQSYVRAAGLATVSAANLLGGPKSFSAKFFPSSVGACGSPFPVYNLLGSACERLTTGTHLTYYRAALAIFFFTSATTTTNYYYFPSL